MADDQVFRADETRPRGNSANVWIIAGIGCGVMLLLCCGAFGAFFYWGAGLARDIVADPVEAAALGQQIAQFDLPEGYQAKAGGNFGAIFGLFGQPPEGAPLRFVIYEGDDPAGTLLLFESAGDRAPTVQERRQMTRSYAPQYAGDFPELKDGELVETVEATVHGEPAEFQIRSTTDADQREVWNVSGEFRTDEGRGFLHWVASREQFDLDQIKQVLESFE
ncbi:MAG: hypothetical protein WDZ59_11590 [Pirellulales bacterium]